MKLIKKIIFIASMFFACGLAVAEGISNGPVVNLTFWINHPGALIRLETMSDPDQCGRTDAYILPDSHEHYKEMYALFLTATASGKKVQIWTHGCE